MSASEKYVFVSGGTGYVGTQVVRLLLQEMPQSPWDAVKVLVRSETSAAQVRQQGAIPVDGNLLQDGGDWQQVAGQATYVIHCAQPSLDVDYNLRVKMEKSLLDALDADRVQRAVFTYGSSYFGNGHESMDETSPRHPIGMGASMEPCVDALEAAGAKGLNYAAAFPGGIYGRGSWFLDSYVAAISSNQAIMLASPPPIWPYIHVLDCARALVYLLCIDAQLLEEAGHNVIVVDDVPISMSEFVSQVAEQMGRQPDVQWVETAEMRNLLPQVAFEYLTANMPHSNARLKSLGFKLRYPEVKQGLESLDLADHGYLGSE